MDIYGLIIVIGCAVWCYALADKQSRNTIWAPIAGFLFGIFAVIFYYCIGKREKK